MRYLIFILFLVLPFTAFSQQQEDQSQEVLYETVLLTPDHTNMKAFQKAMKEHNRTYHNKQGPYEAHVWAINTGPNAGKVMWVMGPFNTYSQLDKRPSGKHDDHWLNVVMPTVSESGTAEYWRLNQDFSKSVDGDYSIIFARTHKINSEYGFLFPDAMKKVSETIKAMDHDTPWLVYVNEFQQGDMGRHIISMSLHNSMAEIDEEWNFRDTFEEVYSKGDWDRWTRTMNLVMDDQYDEIWVHQADVSADTGS